MNKEIELRKDELCPRNNKQIWFILPTWKGREEGEGKTEREIMINPNESHKYHSKN